MYGKTQEDIDMCDITKFYMSAVNCFSTHFWKENKTGNDLSPFLEPPYSKKAPAHCSTLFQPPYCQKMLVKKCLHICCLGLKKKKNLVVFHNRFALTVDFSFFFCNHLTVDTGIAPFCSDGFVFTGNVYLFTENLFLCLLVL